LDGSASGGSLSSVRACKRPLPLPCTHPSPPPPRLQVTNYKPKHKTIDMDLWSHNIRVKVRPTHPPTHAAPDPQLGTPCECACAGRREDRFLRLGPVLRARQDVPLLVRTGPPPVVRPPDHPTICRHVAHLRVWACVRPQSGCVVWGGLGVRPQVQHGVCGVGVRPQVQHGVCGVCGGVGVRLQVQHAVCGVWGVWGGCAPAGSTRGVWCVVWVRPQVQHGVCVVCGLGVRPQVQHVVCGVCGVGVRPQVQHVVWGVWGGCAPAGSTRGTWTTTTSSSTRTCWTGAVTQTLPYPTAWLWVRGVIGCGCVGACGVSQGVQGQGVQGV
jgi:hypothetical protein